MPRKPLIRCDHYPYHVTSRSNNQEWFNVPINEVWQICLKSLKIAYDKHPADVISFVLMANHYHLLINTPNCNLDQFMYELNKNISLNLRQKTNRTNRMFGGRYKWCLIKSNKYLANCYRYIYQNPLRANVVEKCENYPYSTLYYKARGKMLPIPIIDKFGLAHSYRLLWINEVVGENEKRAIKAALYRTELLDLKDPVARRPIP